MGLLTPPSQVSSWSRLATPGPAFAATLAALNTVILADPSCSRLQQRAQRAPDFTLMNVLLFLLH